MNSIGQAKRAVASMVIPVLKMALPYRFSAFNLIFSRFCNATCRMCVKTHFDDQEASKVYLDQQTLDRALLQLRSMRVASISVFPMGEPLVHPRFSAYVEQIVGAGFRVIFSTKGEFVEPKHHKALMKVESIGYSIEGYDEPSVRHYRGVSFEKVIAGLESLRHSLGDKRMTLRTTLYKAMGEEYLERFMATWAPFFDELVVTPANPPHLYHMVLPAGAGVSRDEFFSFERDPKKQCTVGRTGVAILPNGDVAECTEDYSSRFIFGNINKRHLREIIESPELARFQDKARTNEGNICGECCAYYSMVPEQKVQVDVTIKEAHALFARYRRGSL